MNWKAPPADPAKKWLNKSIEIQVMLACNWTCIACDQLSQFGQIAFVKRGTMTMAQIEHFIHEMRSTNSYIGRIRLVGGEPSLHPKLPDILHALHWELVVPGCVHQIEIVTNGSKPDKILAAKNVETPPLPLKVRVSDEGDKQKHHTANFIHTPASLGYEGKACSAPWHCGISLNYYGYWPCSSGAGISRLRDWMKHQRLALPQCVQPCNAVKETWPDLLELCSHCYHALHPEDKIKCGTSDPERNRPSEEQAAHLNPWLGGKQPNWAIYGGQVPVEA
jgi:hypothetical protein